MPQTTIVSNDIVRELNLVPSQTTIEVQDASLVYDEPDADWRYNPETIINQYRNRLFSVLGRLIEIVIPFASFAFGLWWDKVRGRSVVNQPKRAIRLREILTKLGPAYIKIGQALSTRPDLVSPTYLAELSTLQE